MTNSASANDNSPSADTPAWDSVMRIRPSPTELVDLLRHVAGVPIGPLRPEALDAFVPEVLRGNEWRGRDGRWRPCESYEQPRGSRRAGTSSKPTRPVLLDRLQDVGAPWSRWSPAVADGAEFMAGRTVPALGGRQIRFGAVEDAMIALIDAQRAPPGAAYENEPSAGRRRRSRRKPSWSAAKAA